MRLRNLMIVALLLSACVPAMIFGWWSHKTAVEREFDSVSETHLMLAQNLGDALNRYYVDLVAVTESVAQLLKSGHHSSSDVSAILHGLNIERFKLVNKETGRIIAKFEKEPTDEVVMPKVLLNQLLSFARKDKTSISRVMSVPKFPGHINVIYVVRDYGETVSIARISTEYFVELGKSVAFGKKGHATIVDNKGNILAHALPDWVENRRNIAGLTPVKRMLAGETGIERFHSPAHNAEMIAGLTSIKDVGWGVMIPQPVSELYDNARENFRFLMFLLLIAVVTICAVTWLLIRSVSLPLEKLIEELKRSDSTSELKEIEFAPSRMSIKELRDFQQSYNGMVARVARANTEIEELAYTDSVTKLPNRHRFQQLANKMLSKGGSKDNQGCFFFVDIDDFKVINDLYGHETGDKFLQKIAAKLNMVCDRYYETELGGLGGKPVASRIGGDEFTLMVPGLVAPEMIDRFIADILSALEVIGDEIDVSASCGASLGCSRYPNEATDISELMRLADIALYEAKRLGKHCGVLYTAEIGIRTENELRADFAEAISGNQLVLEYQPKVCTATREVSGVEALVRWNHPVLGRLAPNVWLPAISRTSLGTELSDWVIRSAMQDMRALQKFGHKLPFAINLSSEQLTDAAMPAKLLSCAKQHGIDPSRFEIEITEDALFENEEIAFKTMKQVHKNGFRISIDDFGTGYSNFTRLVDLPIDFLKLDKTLIMAGAVDAKVRAILDATVSMARTLDCAIVAEGVETLDSAYFAEHIGADVLQGYFFSAGLPLPRLVNWLEKPDNPVVLYREEAELKKCA